MKADFCPVVNLVFTLPKESFPHVTRRLGSIPSWILAWAHSAEGPLSDGALAMNQSPLDALADRIARIGRRESETALGSTVQMPSESQRVAGMVDQAIAAMDEILKRNEDKTAQALDAVAHWMERNSSENGTKRGSNDAAMSRTLSLLVGRLEEIDAKINKQPEAAAAPLREAITRIEGRLDALGKMSAGRQSDTVSKSLKELDGRLAEIAQRLDKPVRNEKPAPIAEIETKLGAILEALNRQTEGGKARGGRAAPPFPSRRQGVDMRRALTQGDLSGALADISSRQKDLDAYTTRQRLRALGARLDGRFETPATSEAVEDIKQQIAALAQKFDQTARPGDDLSLKTVQLELQAISTALKDAAPRKQMSAIEDAIEKLAEKIADTREQGVNSRVLQPLERQLSDIRTMLESNRDSEHLLELARDIQAMKRRMERVPDRAVDTDLLRDLQSQTAEIRSYVVKSSQKSTGLEALEKRIAAIADRMEQTASDQSGHDLLADISARIDRVHRVVETAPASSIDLSPLESMIDKLNGKIDALASATPASDLDAAVKALEQRLGSGRAEPGNGEVKELLRTISARLDAADMFNPRSDDDVARIIRTLDEKIEQIQLHPPVKAELEKLIKSVEDKIEAMQSRVPDASQFDRMVSELAAQMERAQAPGASEATLDALHDQVSQLARRLEQTDEHFSSLGSLDRSMADIFSQLDSVKHASTEAAEKAAREAVETAMTRLMPAGAPVTDDVRQLVREFTNVKSAQDETDKRTQATLEAVHDTLETIVERLGMLESEMNAERLGPRPAREPAAPRPGADSSLMFASPDPSSASEEKAQAFLGDGVMFAAGPTAPSAPFTFRPSAEPASRSEPHDQHFSAAALLNHDEPSLTRAGQAETAKIESELNESAKALKAAALSPEIDPDLPLEPGAGRPNLGQAADAKSDESELDHMGRMQSARAKFIDAARRAAQAAAEQSSDALDEHGSNPRSKVEGAKKSRVKGATANYRKPLLLGLAAIVFAAGGLSAYNSRHLVFNALGGSLGGGSAAKPPVSPASTTALPVSEPAKEAAVKPASNPSGELQPAVIAAPATVPAQPTVPSDETVKQKVSGSSEPLPASDPITVGAISQRKIPTLAQPAPKQQGSIGIASIGTTPAAEATVEALRLQAEAGNIRAQYELGSRYIDGRGIVPDLKLAVQWLEKAAANGFAPAQYRLGSLYRDGKGIRNDVKLAYAWFKRAAEQGNARAMHNLAVVLAEGSNGAPDYAAAAEWFRKAAEYGIKDSQFNVAILYARGLGTQQDLVQSYKWFAAAADLGDDDAAKKRDEVATKLSPDKLAEAKAAAQTYRPKTLDPLVNDLQLIAQPKPVAAAPATAPVQRQPAKG